MNKFQILSLFFLGISFYASSMEKQKYMVASAYKGKTNPDLSLAYTLDQNRKRYSDDFRKLIMETSPEDARSVVQELRAADSFKNMKIKNTLLTGKTGSGKTMLGEVMAQESGKPYTFVLSALVEDEYEDTADRAFEELKKRGTTLPHIVIFDEISCLDKKKPCVLWRFLDFCERSSSNFYTIGVTEGLKDLSPYLQHFFARNSSLTIPIFSAATNLMRKKIISFYLKDYKYECDDCSLDSLMHKLSSFSNRGLKDIVRLTVENAFLRDQKASIVLPTDFNKAVARMLRNQKLLSGKSSL